MNEPQPSIYVLDKKLDLVIAKLGQIDERTDRIEGSVLGNGTKENPGLNTRVTVLEEVVSANDDKSTQRIQFVSGILGGLITGVGLWAWDFFTGK